MQAAISKSQQSFQEGILHLQRGIAQKALACFQEAIQFNPSGGDAYLGLGLAFNAVSDRESAKQAFEKAVRFSPQQAAPHFELGRILSQEGKDKEALSCYKAAIDLDPQCATYHFNFSSLLMKIGYTPQASVGFRKVLSLDPDYVEAWNALGAALNHLGQSQEAAACYQKAIALRPQYIDAYNGLGLLLCDLGDSASGEQCFRLAMQIRQTTPLDKIEFGIAQQWQLQINLCRSLEYQKKYEAAITLYREAIAQNPENALLHFNLGLLLLSLNRFQEGWREYEWRLKMSANSLAQRQFSSLQWNGEHLNGKSILLYAEQGYGDTLQFVRYVELVVKQGATVYLEVQPALLKLLGNIPGVQRVVTRKDECPETEWHCSLMSLPYIFQSTEDTLPDRTPYIDVSAELEQRQEDGKLRIGLVWAGNKAHENDRHRSIPLNEFLPLGELNHIKLFSLQVGDASKEIAELSSEFAIEDPTSGFRNFADTAAFIKTLDLVITVDTSVAHLAGALGMPVWILLAHNRTDWRWQKEGNSSRWYPTAKLFRQKTPGNWSEVISEVKRELNQELERPLHSL